MPSSYIIIGKGKYYFIFQNEYPVVSVQVFEISSCYHWSAVLAQLCISCPHGFVQFLSSLFCLINLSFHLWAYRMLFNHCILWWALSYHIIHSRTRFPNFLFHECLDTSMWMSKSTFKFQNTFKYTYAYAVSTPPSYFILFSSLLPSPHLIFLHNLLHFDPLFIK